MFGDNFDKVWGASSPENIASLLRSKECSLEKLLDEEEILSEMQTSNAELLAFFNLKRVNELLDYVTIEPTMDQGEKRCFKFPYIASEILAGETKEIIESFFLANNELEPVQNEKPVLQEEKSILPEKSVNQEDTKDKAPSIDSTKPEKKIENMDSSLSGIPVMIENQLEKPTPQLCNNTDVPLVMENKIETEGIVDVKGNPRNDSAGSGSGENQEKAKTALDLLEDKVGKLKEHIKQLAMEEGCSHSKEETKGVSKPLPKKCLMFEKLLSILRVPEEINPVLAGYFTKIFQNLLEKKQIDVLEYLFSFPEHIKNLLRHCDNKSISEALKKIISNEDKFLPTVFPEEFLLEKMQIIDQLIDLTESANSKDLILNSSLLLAGLIENRQHLAYFNEGKVLARVFKIALSGNPHSLVASLTYINSLLKLNSTMQAPAGEQFCFIGVDTLQTFEQKEEEELDYKSIINLSIENLPYFKHYLEAPTPGKVIAMQFGQDVIPFGQDKLSVVDYFFHLIKLKNDMVCLKMDELEVPKLLLSLFKTYYANSILHGKIVRIFDEAINSNIDFLVDSFTIRCCIGEAILDLVANNEIESFKKLGKSVKKPYAVFVTKLSNIFIAAAKKRKEVEEYIKGINGWMNYQEDHLSIANTKENTTLGGKGESIKEEKWETIDVEEHVLDSLAPADPEVQAEFANKLAESSENPPPTQEEEVTLELPANRGSRNKKARIFFKEAQDIENQERTGRGRNSMGKCSDSLEDNIFDNQPQEISCPDAASPEESPYSREDIKDCSTDSPSKPANKLLEAENLSLSPEMAKVANPSIKIENIDPNSEFLVTFASNNYWRLDSQYNAQELAQEFF